MAGPSEQGVGGLLTSAVEHMTRLVRGEIALARAEMAEKAQSALMAVGFLLVGLILAQTTVNVLAAAIVAALVRQGLDPDLSALIVTVVTALGALFVMYRGVAMLRDAISLPSRSAQNVRRDVETLKESVEK